MLTTIFLTVFMSGIALLERISSDFTASQMLPEKTLTKIGTALRFFYFSVVVLLFFLNLKTKWMIFWFLILITLVFSILFFAFRKMKDTRITNADWLCFIEDMILLMKAGRGFREALRLCLPQQPTRFSSYYNRWIDHVVFLQQAVSIKGRGIPLFVKRLCEIDEKPHEAMSRLLAWRDELRFIEKFRRKSGQALYSFRFQSVVVLVIYIAASIYSFTKYPSTVVLPFFLFSFVWLLVGGGVFLQWSQKRKWKV